MTDTWHIGNPTVIKTKKKKNTQPKFSHFLHLSHSFSLIISSLLLFYTSQFAIPTPNFENQGPVWYTHSNTCFQFLNNITRISTLFYLHVFPHMFSNTCFQFLNACTKHPPSLPFSFFYPYTDFPS